VFQRYNRNNYNNSSSSKQVPAGVRIKQQVTSLQKVSTMLQSLLLFSIWVCYFRTLHAFAPLFVAAKHHQQPDY